MEYLWSQVHLHIACSLLIEQHFYPLGAMLKVLPIWSTHYHYSEHLQLLFLLQFLVELEYTGWPNKNYTSFWYFRFIIRTKIKFWSYWRYISSFSQFLTPLSLIKMFKCFFMNYVCSFHPSDACTHLPDPFLREV